jgi:predicted acyl esterase
MPDGCRLAADVFVPDGGTSVKRPTIAILTPYCRRFALAPGATNVEASPNTSSYRDMFVPRGYVVAVVDGRGTGASFGTRDAFRSPRERQDYRAIADWIVAQPWSDGSTLDHDRRDLRQQFSYFRDPALLGPAPVDADIDGSEAKAAVRSHLANFRMPDFMSDFKFRDDRLAYDPDFNTTSFSPCNYVASVPEDVAVHAISGWTDGAGYANGSIARRKVPHPTTIAQHGHGTHLREAMRARCRSEDPSY